MEPLKLIFNLTIRTHYVLIFITGIATSFVAACADLQNCLIQDVWEMRGWNQPVLTNWSSALHALGLRVWLQSWCPGKSVIRIKARIPGPDVQSQLSPSSLSTLTPCWMTEKNPSCILERSSSQTHAAWLRKSISGLCDSFFWSSDTGWFLLAFWVQAKPNPSVPHKSRWTHKALYQSVGKLSKMCICGIEEPPGTREASPGRASLGPDSSRTVMLTKVTPYFRAEVM